MGRIPNATIIVYPILSMMCLRLPYVNDSFIQLFMTLRVKAPKICSTSLNPFKLTAKPFYLLLFELNGSILNGLRFPSASLLKIEQILNLDTIKSIQGSCLVVPVAKKLRSFFPLDPSLLLEGKSHMLSSFMDLKLPLCPSHKIEDPPLKYNLAPPSPILQASQLPSQLPQSLKLTQSM